MASLLLDFSRVVRSRAMVCTDGREVILTKVSLCRTKGKDWECTSGELEVFTEDFGAEIE